MGVKLTAILAAATIALGTTNQVQYSPNRIEFEVGQTKVGRPYYARISNISNNPLILTITPYKKGERQGSLASQCYILANSSVRTTNCLSPRIQNGSVPAESIDYLMFETSSQGVDVVLRDGIAVKVTDDVLTEYCAEQVRQVVANWQSSDEKRESAIRQVSTFPNIQTVFAAEHCMDAAFSQGIQIQIDAPKEKNYNDGA